MRERHITQAYTDSFQKFLSSTDEKVVLLKEITERIEKNEPDSLLDIGAGNGDLAIPISKLVKRYVALEQKPDYVSKLRENDIEVIEATFPHDIHEKFDFILTSHSLPWKEEKYKPFIESALDLLNDEGIFLGITYDDENGDWNQMLLKCKLQLDRVHTNRLENMEIWLSSFKTFKKTIITTYVRTGSLETIMGALAFVYSDGDEIMIEEFMNSIEIREYVKNNYINEKGYYFPFNHIFLEIKKA